MLTILNIAYPFFLLPYILRRLGPESNGIVNWASSFVSYFILTANLGIATFAIRETARIRDDKSKLEKFLGSVLTLLGISTVCLLFIYIAIVFLIPGFSDKKSLMLIFSTQLLMGAFALDWFFAGIERFKVLFFRSLFIKTLTLLATFLLIKGPEDYLCYAFILVVSYSGSNLVNLGNILIKYKINLQFSSLKELSHILKRTFPLFVLSVVVSFYQNLPITVLGFLTTYENVGYYSTTYRIVQLLLSVSGAAVIVMLPRISALNSKGYTLTVNDSLKLFYPLNAFLILSMSIFIFICAPEIILVISGADWEDAIPLLRVMSLVLLGSGFSTPLVHMVYLPANKDRIVLMTAGIGLILSLIILAFVIPAFGFRAAPWGIVIAELSIFALLVLFSKKVVSSVLISSSMARVVIGTLLFGVVLWFFNRLDLSGFLMIFVITPIGFVLSFMFTALVLKVPELKMFIKYFRSIVGVNKIV